MIGRIYVGYHLLLLHTKYKSSGPHGRLFSIFSYCMTTGDDDPRGVANLDHRGMIGRIYVEYHLTLLHTKYTSFMPCGYREVDFKCFPIISLWQIMTPHGVANLDPRVTIGRNYKGAY